MWIITDASSGEQKVIYSGPNCTVGRRPECLIKSADKSLSRNHCALEVKQFEECQNLKAAYPRLVLRDMSRFGSFVNGEKMESKQSREVTNGDILSFGSAATKYRVNQIPAVWCYSRLDEANKKTVMYGAVMLGAHVTKKWTSKCTHLIHDSATVTEKLLLALTSERPIITSQWVADLWERKSFSDFKKFSPAGVQVSKNSSRKTMFKGKTFILLCKPQYESTLDLIRACAGTSTYLTSVPEGDFWNSMSEFAIVDPFQNNSQIENDHVIEALMDEIFNRNFEMTTSASIGNAIYDADLSQIVFNGSKKEKRPSTEKMSPADPPKKKQRTGDTASAQSRHDSTRITLESPPRKQQKIEQNGETGDVGDPTGDAGSPEFTSKKPRPRTASKKPPVPDPTYEEVSRDKEPVAELDSELHPINSEKKDSEMSEDQEDNMDEAERPTLKVDAGAWINIRQFKHQKEQEASARKISTKCADDMEIDETLEDSTKSSEKNDSSIISHSKSFRKAWQPKRREIVPFDMSEGVNGEISEAWLVEENRKQTDEQLLESMFSGDSRKKASVSRSRRGRR
eukprot:9672_1